MLFSVFTLVSISIYTQDLCSHLEGKIESLTRAGISVEEAEKLYKEYTSLTCADFLLAYNLLGVAEYENSNFQKAREYLVKGEKEFFEKETVPEHFALNQMYIALILIVEKDYESAMYYLMKAEDYANRGKNKRIQAAVFQNLGLIKIHIGELNEAETYYNKAIATAVLDSTDIGYIYQNLAFLHLKRDNREKTKDFINKTKDVWNDLNFHKGQYLLSFIESKLAIKENKFDQGLKYLENGRAQYKNENKLLLGENYLLEAQMHDSLGNTAAKIIALENAIIESIDLTEEQLKNTITNLSNLQDKSNTNLLLAELVSKLKRQNISQKSINTLRNKIKDTETVKDEAVIKTQVYYLLLLGTLSLLLSYLIFRIKRQKSDIQTLNQNLESSKIEIEQNVETLKQKNQELERFAYVASHDLKSPLRTISSYAGLVKRKLASNEVDEYLDIITKSSQHMSDMISDLLDYATLDQDLNIENVNLKSLIEHTTELIEKNITETNSNIIIDKSCDQIIQCDKRQFSSVIQNLISNGIIYSKQTETPEIIIACSKKNNQTLITFSDNGIGIEDAYKDQIFEMFKRLKTKKISGTGIGLAICKKIVEGHEGQISVESNVGVGSVFTVAIPNRKNL